MNTKNKIENAMPLPSKEQMRKTIANGNDREYNILTLDFNGKFVLYQHSVSKFRDFLVAWAEGFGPGNGYVGPRIAANDKYIDALYAMFIEAWLSYKSQPNIRLRRRYLDVLPNQTANEIIEAWLNEDDPTKAEDYAERMEQQEAMWKRIECLFVSPDARNVP